MKNLGKFCTILIFFSWLTNTLCNANQAPHNDPHAYKQMPPMVVNFNTGLKVQQVFHQTEALIVVRGIWQINQEYSVGLLISKLLAEPSFYSDFSGHTNAIFAIAGFELGFHMELLNNLFLSPQVLLGITSMPYYHNFLGEYSANDTLVIEPGLYLNYTITNILQLNLGLGYHFTLGSEGAEFLTHRDLDSPVIEIGISLGSF